MIPAQVSVPARIAIVEDDDDTRRMLSYLLGNEGYEVVEFHDAAEALGVLRNGPVPDLILLDLRMPGMDGWQFRIEQKKHIELSGTPVIALSADGSSQARAIDVDAFLEKPPVLDELLACVRRVLEQSKGARERARLVLLEGMAAVGTLAAGLAHEINNPLAYVLANLDLVRDELGRLKEGGALDASARNALVVELDEMLAEAQEGACRIQKIVGDMRAVSPSDDQPLLQVNINAVLESALSVAAAVLDTRARVIRSFGQPPPIVGNAGRLGQVFLNLLINAAHSIPEGSANGQIEIVTRTGEAGEAVISITDNGDGIPPEIRKRIFEPFFTTKGTGEGSGLGLAICHGVVSSMGGTISVESQKGKGSTFEVSFPPHGSQIRALRNPPPLPNLRILLIDDEPAIGRALARVLRTEHEVTVVESGAAGVARASEEPFDILLCDLAMPEVPGAEVFEQIRALGSGMEKRMVFMTGGAFTERDRAFVASVDNVVLSKPIEKEVLWRALRVTLDRL